MTAFELSLLIYYYFQCIFCPIVAIAWLKRHCERPSAIIHQIVAHSTREECRVGLGRSRRGHRKRRRDGSMEHGHVDVYRQFQLGFNDLSAQFVAMTGKTFDAFVDLHRFLGTALQQGKRKWCGAFSTQNKLLFRVDRCYLRSHLPLVQQLSVTEVKICLQLAVCRGTSAFIRHAFNP